MAPNSNRKSKKEKRVKKEPQRTRLTEAQHQRRLRRIAEAPLSQQAALREDLERIRHRGVRPAQPSSNMADSTNNNNNDAEDTARASIGRHAQGAAMDPPARGDDDDNDNNNNNDDEDHNPLLRQLLRHLREFCADKNSIDVEKARNVLEACAGNIMLAGQLYWDDYFASQAHDPSEASPAAAAAAAAAPDPEEDEDQGIRRRLEGEFERYSFGRQRDSETRSYRSLKRRWRRARFNEQDAGQLPEADPPGGNDADRNDVEQDIHMEEAPAGDGVPEPRNDDNERPWYVVAARAVAAVAANRNPVEEESASVSDEEPNVEHFLRTVEERSQLGKRRRRHVSGSLNMAEELEREIKQLKAQKKINAGGDGDGDDSSNSSDGESDDEKNKHLQEDDDDEDAYLSDNDWLFTPASVNNTLRPLAASAGPASSTSQPYQPLRPPVDILWQGLLSQKASTPTKESMQMGSSFTDDGSEGAVVGENNNNAGDTASNEDGNNNGQQGSKKRPDIPTTWLHASFSPDSTAMGLVVKEPKREELAEHSNRIHQWDNPASPANNRGNNLPPLPYHCRALTAVLSIINAMIYTGACIQSNQVTTASSRVPFLELSEEDRKREFEPRLTDALSALILIAAQSSIQRKKKVLDKIQQKTRKRRKKRLRKMGLDPSEADPKEQALEKKLRLVPVAWWPEASESGEPRLPAEQLQVSLEDSSKPKLQIQKSFSNISDIRAYVLSSMRSFMAPGGVALFLETILDIHGKSAVVAMLRKSRRAASSRSNEKSDYKRSEKMAAARDPYLVLCTCEERQQQRLNDPCLKPAERRKLLAATDTTPPSHECISVELISLMLTGKVHSSFHGWSAGSLGFGMLSNRSGEVGRALRRPEKPVWICRGDTCYSVLMMDYTSVGDSSDENKATTAPNGNSEKTTAAYKSKRDLKTGMPKAAPVMRISQCSSTSRSRDLLEASSFAQNDKSGYVANLLHWNCWYGQRNKSSFRLITARATEWRPPIPSELLTNYKNGPKTHTLAWTSERKSVTEQLKERPDTVVSADEHDLADSGQSAIAAVRHDENMAKIRVHPDDPTFYPKNHRMWRFDMGEKGEGSLDRKPRGNHWTPYFALNLKEQVLVDMKLGPKINKIIFTRWPGATVDKLTPGDKNEPPPIV